MQAYMEADICKIREDTEQDITRTIQNAKALIKRDACMKLFSEMKPYTLKQMHQEFGLELAYYR